MVIYGYLVMNGEIPSEISIMQPSFQLIGLALFLNSVMIQRKFAFKEDAARKQDKELQKKSISSRDLLTISTVGVVTCSLIF